jgi:membrane protein insertase Oxa1/YidC/SpoIIIJ
VLLLLLQTPALVNFVALAFSNTVVLTDIDTIMNNCVRYTTFFIYFFDNNVFIFLLLAFTVLTICLIYALPDDSKRNHKRLKAKIDKMQTDLAAEDKLKNKKTKGLGLANITAQAKAKSEGKTDGGNQNEEDDEDEVKYKMAGT